MVSASLKAHGYFVQLIFLPRSFLVRYNQKLLKRLVETVRDCGMVGLSVMSESVLNAIQITQALKERVPAVVVWGGVHPTIRPNECLQFADVVCVGEGEIAAVELAARIAANVPYDNVPGMWTKTNTRRLRPLLQDIDALPFPDHDYSSHLISVRNNIVPLTMKRWAEQTGGEYFAMATRGCPFGCTYCANNAVNKLYPGQRILRKRSPGNLTQELVKAKGTLPVSRIVLDDDSFFMNAASDVRRFAQSYKEQVALPLAIMGAHPTTITEEKLAPLVDAGLTSVRIGIQSASENTRKLYRRNHTIEQIRKAVHILERHPQVERKYDVILDNPWESDSDLRETLFLFLSFQPPYKLILYSLEYYPGTDLHAMALAHGLVEDTIEAASSSTYLAIAPTWLNKLFILVRDCAACGRGISPIEMALMIGRGIEGRLLYWRFKTLGIGNKVRFAKELVGCAVADILRLDFSRMYGFIVTRFIAPRMK
jgi:radical SAM superfamily enzyme YgiQ (UPF0313 family)